MRTAVFQDMKDKIVLITGASSGIGLAAALLLAERGAEIVMVCRDRIRGNFMRKGVAEHATGRPPALLFADLSSQEQIRILAEQVCRSYDRIDVLINNAGAVFASRELTEDGIERTLAVNYLAPFLLTRLLLDLILASPEGRVINVAVRSHSDSLDFSELQGGRPYNFVAAYRRSKLCNVLFTYELARRLSATRATANCLSPVPTVTRIGENMTGWPAALWKFVKWIPFVFAYPELGARTHVYVASSPDLRGIYGRCFSRCREARTKPVTYDTELSAKLWEVSEALCARSTHGRSLANPKCKSDLMWSGEL